MAEITLATIQAHFDAEARAGRRLLADPNTVSGLGTYLKYHQAASLMAEEGVTNVLDVGCNRGSIEALFQRLYPARAQTTLVEGVDISSEAIRQATELHLANCNFRTYDGSRLPYADERFDLVVLVEVIEHVVEKEALLSEIRRVLRPSGRLFLTTPNPECLALRVETALWRSLRRLLGKPQQEKDAYICNRHLEAMLSQAGFLALHLGRMYSWPHLFVCFNGWSLFPPLPPRALYHFQLLCLRLLNHNRLPEYLDKRLKWSQVGLFLKQSSDQYLRSGASLAREDRLFLKQSGAP